MKRKIMAILMVMVVVFSCLAGVGCELVDSLFHNSLEDFVKLTANIGDAKSLGFITGKLQSDDSSTERSMITAYADEANDDGTLSFIKQDANNQIKSVDFVNNTKENIFLNGKLIRPGESIGQDQFGYSIRKMYVDTYRNLTYIQLIDSDYAIEWNGIPARPEGLVYDENGLSDFDSESYYNYYYNYKNISFSVISYVIDNTTGKIYSLEGLYICKIRPGLVIMQEENENWEIDKETNEPSSPVWKDPLVYDIKIQNDDLVFTPLYTNGSIQPVNCFRDEYGYVYIENNSYEEIDKENKLIFHTGQYQQANCGTVLYGFYDRDYYNYVRITDAKKLTGELVFEALSMDDVYNLKFSDELFGPFDNFDMLSPSHLDYEFTYYISKDEYRHIKIYHIVKGYIYNYKLVDRTGENCLYIDDFVNGALFSAGGGFGNLFLLDERTIVKIEGDKISYVIIDFEKDYRGVSEDGFSTSFNFDWIVLSEGMKLDFEWSREKLCYIAVVETPMSKQSYMLQVKETDGVERVELVSLEDWVKEKEEGVVVLKPIN